MSQTLEQRRNHPIPHAVGSLGLLAERPLHLAEGMCYLVRGKAIDTSYRLFRFHVERGRPGLCASRIFPERVRERHGLFETPIWWISNSPGDRNLNPTALGTLATVIERFIGEHPAGSVTLLDGLEYIINNVGFDKTLLFLEHLSHFVMPRDANVLIPVDPACFDQRDFARLARFHESLDEQEVRKSLDSCDLEQTFLIAR